MSESGEPGFLDRMEDQQSAGLFLKDIGFSSIIIAGKGNPVTCGVLSADDALSRGLADAPQKTLALFADTDGRTVYVGDKEKVEGLTATIKLGPVEVILDGDKRYLLLSLTERAARLAFNICPVDLSEDEAPALVDFLRKRHPRPAF